VLSAVEFDAHTLRRGSFLWPTATATTYFTVFGQSTDHPHDHDPKHERDREQEDFGQYGVGSPRDRPRRTKPFTQWGAHLNKIYEPRNVSEKRTCAKDKPRKNAEERNHPSESTDNQPTGAFAMAAEKESSPLLEVYKPQAIKEGKGPNTKWLGFRVAYLMTPDVLKELDASLDSQCTYTSLTRPHVHNDPKDHSEDYHITMGYGYADAKAQAEAYATLVAAGFTRDDVKLARTKDGKLDHFLFRPTEKDGTPSKTILLIQKIDASLRIHNVYHALYEKYHLDKPVLKAHVTTHYAMGVVPKSGSTAILSKFPDE
jgi:hypothetical protein